MYRERRREKEDAGRKDSRQLAREDFERHRQKRGKQMQSELLVVIFFKSRPV